MTAVARLVPMLARGRRRGDGATSLLAILAFAVTSGFAISVLGGLHAFTVRAADPPAGLAAIDAQPYVTLAWVALALLVVPIGALGGAAARLGTARRDARLATLRLLGATPGQVGALTVIETLGQAAIGAVAGLALYGALLPIWTSLTFQRHRLTVAEMWPGVGGVALAVGGVIALAGLSAVAALRRVAITPLGVATRQRPRGLSALRLVVLIVALLAWAIATRGSGESLAAVLVACLAGVLAAFNLVGALLVALLGRAMTAGARRPGTLLAARRLVDDPKAAWRVVGGPSLACFVATVLGVMPTMTAGGATQDAEFSPLRDVQTGAWLTVGIAFAIAAASAGITQLASVLDRRREFALAHLAGVGEGTLQQGRRRELAASLLFTAGGASLTGLAVLAPFGLTRAATDPTALAITGGCILGGMALVLLAGEAARPALRTILRRPEPRPD